MQSVSRQEPTNNLRTQTRIIAFIAVFLFALAGLISGFAVGAFLRPGQQVQTNNPNQSITTPITSQLTTPTHTPRSSHPVKLGWPVIDQYRNTEVANGTTTLSLSAYAVDQSIDPGHGNPVRASGITFKLWLVQRIPANGLFLLPTSDLQNVNSIQNPLTGTVQSQPYAEVSGLNFDPNTQQTHPSNAKGKVTWKYQLSPSVTPGDYDLVVLADWNGRFFNWSWTNIEITK